MKITTETSYKAFFTVMEEGNTTYGDEPVSERFASLKHAISFLDTVSKGKLVDESYTDHYIRVDIVKTVK